MKRSLLVQIICMLLVLLWAYAALSKLTGFTAFGSQLKLQPLPARSIPVFKTGLPVIELITAMLICFQRTRMKGLIISSLLMVAFTFYVVFALGGAFGEIPCSCAGIISSFRWQGHLVFNIVFTVISLAGVYLEKHKDGHFVKHRPSAV